MRYSPGVVGTSMLKRSEMLITLIKLSPQKAANSGVARDLFTPKIFHLQTGVSALFLLITSRAILKNYLTAENRFETASIPSLFT